jgi:radical SAM protein
MPDPRSRAPYLPVPQAFDAAPLVVIWEVTRACDLLCVHCRADAIPRREEGELTTREGMRLLDEVRRFGRPRVVLTGGDPLKRQDIFDLLEHGTLSGLDMSLSPSATPLVTRQALERAAGCGASGVSISIDGPDARSHDVFRGVPGTFARSLEAARTIVELGMDLHVNTTVARHNLHRLEAMAALVRDLEARRWSLFFLVPVGRATDALQLTAGEFEEVFRWLDRLSDSAPFRIKTTEGPHYRRVALQEWAARTGEEPARLLERSASANRRFIPGMNDGRGFVFISWRGDIQPSGFLPLTAANVRRASLVETYRSHPLFRELRDPDLLRGRCGACEYRWVCGGSRARALAVRGHHLAEDPACAYRPESWVGCSSAPR